MKLEAKRAIFAKQDSVQRILGRQSVLERRTMRTSCAECRELEVVAACDPPSTARPGSRSGVAGLSWKAAALLGKRSP